MTMPATTPTRAGLLASSLVAGLALGGAASAQEFTLRIQTHYAPETPSGKLAAQFADDVETMSGGRVDIEMFYSSSVVKSVETFDAAATGILDGDMTGGAYQTGKNPAFQFVGDPMGGYDTPWQQYAWFYYGGGKDLAEELYHEFNMELIGWWIYGQESLASTKPLAGPDDLKDWKFRSPPGLETEIFAKLGASPIVMDFTEIFTALETGIIDGTDASGLANNVGLGLYDIAKHATYPGFHSMPSDHLAIRKDVWDGLPEDIQRIFEVAMQKLAFQTALTFEVENAKAAAELPEKGVTLHEWSPEQRAEFRTASLEAWETWADRTPQARAIVDSHYEFMGLLGLRDTQ
jgi:TRAP-type mannitol/chloroaromatic compound transport system substrate-binding protein